MKNILYILIFIIGLNFTSFAQNKPAEPQQKYIKLYPIPASTVITFDFVRGYDRSFSIQIYNFMGKKVYEVKNTPSRISLPLNEFYRGLYYYHLLDKNNRLIEIGRFQIVK
ncbi:MAG: T9SS type A sorting domain-containing protein [Chitinophagaceae bacterium]|nr:T9SS type A sorting domain-containing protein [Chitinophagaceae bacterium]